MLMRERHLAGGSVGTIDATTLDGGQDTSQDTKPGIDEVLADLRDGDPKQPNLIDKYVGKEMRKARRAQKLSQEELGKRVGLTFQQIQKYEKGVNRCSAGRLWQIAHELNVPMMSFFPEYEQPVISADVFVSSQVTTALDQIKNAGRVLGMLKSHLVNEMETDDGETED